MTTPTEPSTPEVDVEALCARLEWLARDWRADELLVLQQEGETHAGWRARLYATFRVSDAPVHARLTLQAERAAQEIERRETAHTGALRMLWSRIFAGR